MPDSEVEKKKKFRSLAANLAKIFLFLILGVILISNGLQLYLNFQTQQQGINSQLYLVAENAADSVKSFIQERFSMLETAASVGLSAGVKEEQKNVIDKLLGHESSFRQLALFNKEGQEFIEVSRLSAAASGKLESRFENNLFDLVKQGKIYFGPVYIDETSSEPMAIIAVPVRNVFGDFQGTLVAEVNLKFTWDLIGGIKVGNKGVAYVVDQKGNLIGFGDISRVLKGENLARLEAVNQFIKSEGISNTPGINKLNITKGIQGTNIVSSYVPLGLPDWAVVVELPATEAYQGVIYQFGFTLLIIILTIGLGAASGVYISKIITRPIINLRNIAEEISKGNLKARAEIKSQDEIGQLSSVFNEMTSRLAAYTGELESKVAERTAELAKKLKELVESNTELKKTQSAMLNLLEDARRLEEELKKEKANVEQKVIERTHELQEEHARLTASINSLSFGFILVDINNKIILKNIALGRILEMPEKDLTIEAIAKSFGKEIDLKAKVEQCLKEKKIIELKDIKFGKKFLRLFLAPIIMLHDSDEVIGYVVLIEDITEAKVLERSREEFFSIASHELRTPLTAIRGNASLIQEFYLSKIKDKDVVKMIADMHEASIRLIKIVSDFLDVSRLEQGRVEFEKKPFDVAVLIHEVIGELEKIATDKKLYLKLEKTDAAPVMAMADRDKTKQVLINLIGNAINYTPKGGITVKLEKQDKFLKIYVTDTGVGILPENQALLFRKFQQAGAKVLTRDVTRGTGLGLYISKLLVEIMGGTIELVKSQPDKGSTFGFTLPVS